MLTPSSQSLPGPTNQRQPPLHSTLIGQEEDSLPQRRTCESSSFCLPSPSCFDPQASRAPCWLDKRFRCLLVNQRTGEPSPFVFHLLLAYIHQLSTHITLFNSLFQLPAQHISISLLSNLKGKAKLDLLSTSLFPLSPSNQRSRTLLTI